MLRSWPHSQRTYTSPRSPLVPRSSIHKGRRHSVGSVWTYRYQSMSLMCPALQARTKRTGTTVCRCRLSSTNRPFCKVRRCTSRRERTCGWSAPRRTSRVMHHSGKCQALMPDMGAAGSS